MESNGFCVVAMRESDVSAGSWMLPVMKNDIL